MEFQTNFKILKINEIKRKNADNLPEAERSFFKVDLLDNQNNPCSMMIFGKEKLEKITKLQLKPLQDVVIAFRLVYNNNNWNVSFIDIEIR